MIEGPYTFDEKTMKIRGTLKGKPVDLLTMGNFYQLTGKTFKADFGLSREKALAMMAERGRDLCAMLNGEDMI